MFKFKNIQFKNEINNKIVNIDNLISFLNNVMSFVNCQKINEKDAEFEPQCFQSND